MTSSPLYPRSNGLAERNVQTIKRLFTKASEDGTEWQLALLNFRNTPIAGETNSPAQLLMGRLLKTRLPMTDKALQPQLVSPSQLASKRQQKARCMKSYYDRGRELPPLNIGDRVRVLDGKVWKGAHVNGKDENDRSYWVKLDNGGIYRRNRSHIMKIPNGPASQQSTHTYDHEDFFSDVNGRSEVSLSNEREVRDDSPPQPHSQATTSTVRAPYAVKFTRSGREVRPTQRFVPS